ncbi:flavodoxin domain-containing protein [Tropicimonas sp. TH_r6]|uniref:diflavin oxidoreductase n=1 Tax=Tropicimonas sp. TH_r6 TaxID=3082085 RepID=UPI002953B6D5|nr:flavodoxin domain-containing protein [Tropicimonas sp. TH_r6]MDV7142130.1 flavodoxin domain-containing protein [Tropicimonas sp. TH_r6]
MTAQDPNILQNLALAIGQTQSPASPEFIPEDAPFDPAQRHWLNGLLTGLHAIAASATTGGDAESGTALCVLYGSQSGNCESLSKDLRKFARTQGFEASVAALDDIELSDLASVSHLLILAATFGEGEPTDNSARFHSALMAEGAPALPTSLNFSVCGLGDSSYAEFNKAARDIDSRLEELGATRAAPLTACDLDFEEDYANWKAAAFESDAFRSAAGSAAAPEPVEIGPAFDKNTPFMASLMVSQRLSGAGSAKCVNHVELSLAGGGEDLNYSVGDALGVWPVNDPAEVAEILAVSGLSGRETVQLKSGPAQLRPALLTRLDLTTVTPKTVERWGLAENSCDAQVIDLLRRGNLLLDAQGLADGLRPLQPRLYSISSSPAAHPGEVHLTVGEVRYEKNDTPRQGVASTYLGERLAQGGMVGVYVQRSAHFHLPDDDTRPLIMIGPGTGIAPFRAFLEDRAARGSTGKNWLFFGDQHEACDYLYRDQIEDWRDSGVLTRTSLAWSRDGTDKVYVQTLLERDGADIYRWLEDGAAIYICGDAARMAADVEQALLRVIAEHGGLSPSEAAAYLERLSGDHRYQRDVY